MTDSIQKTTFVKAPLDRVWRAISDHREFGEWFRVALDQPFKAGQPSTGKMTYPGYEGHPWRAEVEAVEPTHRFAFRWHPYGIDPNADLANEPTTLVEFLLQPEGDGTRVTIKESGFDALPEARRDSALRGNEKGWEEQKDNLREFAEAHANA
jgi:uncharacterized protein YndB with AHSA1/START domain